MFILDYDYDYSKKSFGNCNYDYDYVIDYCNGDYLVVWLHISE